MSRTIGIAIAGGVALLAASGCAQARFNLKWKNKAAPDFELESLEGGKVRLSSFRGHPVLLSFWGYT